ncbi:MAG: hypothetical protein LJE75_12615 [Gammaproteobacteria bacterium]|nr:hypothetical protein [Gammaproteobacteria bacterium]
MTRVLPVLFFVLLLSILGLVTVAGIDTSPLVEPASRLSHQDLEPIKQLLRRHDPRQVKKQEVRSLSLTERDLNLLLKYAAPHTLNTSSRVALRPDGMKVLLTFKLPESALGNYLNITAELSGADGGIHLERLAVGRLSLPVWLIEPLLLQVHRAMLARNEEYRTVAGAISSYRFYDDRLVIEYQTDPKLVERLRQRGKVYLFPEADTQRILAYHQELVRLSGQSASPHVSLGRLLPPLFQLAASRTGEGGDPQAENRALLLTLMLYAMGKNIGQFVEVPRQPPVHRLHLSVLGRHDLVQHYLVSAALTVSAGSGLAGAMGEFKELDDSRGGTGFSFADLLADRAGIRLAEMAMGTESQARLLQQRMGDSALLETDFMPSIKDLPEGIMELEFKHRYQDLDSKNYRMIEDEIELRLSRCKVYRPPEPGTL